MACRRLSRNVIKQTVKVNFCEAIYRKNKATFIIIKVRDAIKTRNSGSRAQWAYSGCQSKRDTRQGSTHLNQFRARLRMHSRTHKQQFASSKVIGVHFLDETTQKQNDKD